jgi:lantibiotic modifying enzyme
VIGAFDAAREALRWVTGISVTTAGGSTWPLTAAADAPLSDDLYDGTAGVLVALAEARLSGITEFDDHARAAALRLRAIASAGADRFAAPDNTDDEPGRLDLGLYTGLSGCAAALSRWASAAADAESAAAAEVIAADISRTVATGNPVSAWLDLIRGNAGIIVTLIDLCGQDAGPAIAVLAEQIVAQARSIDGQPDWYPRAGQPVFFPNFSHGAAGIGYALAAASQALRREDLLDLARAAGQRLVRLGSRPDGTLAVPGRIEVTGEESGVSYGWCHGPTGTMRLFELLERLDPGDHWADAVRAAARAVRTSGLPARLYPGFWDNLGQCCGSAGVGEMALDRYAQTGDTQWLQWAVSLAGDVLDRRIEDDAGIRWSHTEHRQQPPGLDPQVGWMQGAAGIAGWLLRLARAEREGASAQRIRLPDQP